MFVMTMTKRKLLRAIMFVLVLITGIAIGVFAILSSINTGAEGVKVPIYCVGRSDNKISITFDCAWANSNTDELIAILGEYDVKATFFVTGEFCDKYGDDVKKLHSAGHEIQNHSDKHPHVNGMNINDLIADTKSCSSKIEMLTGEKPTLYRAPYGEYDDKVLTTIEGMNYNVIQWNTDSIDWDKPSPETIIERTTKNVSSGSILLFHNDLENTTKALPDILKSLKEQGFEMCRVSELIYTENYTIDSTGKQISKDDAQHTVVYSNIPAVNDVFEELSEKLTSDDIERMQQDIPSAIAEISSMLTPQQLTALKDLTPQQLSDAFEQLKTAVAQKEAGKDEPIIAETTVSSQSESVSPLPDKDGKYAYPVQ